MPRKPSVSASPPQPRSDKALPHRLLRTPTALYPRSYRTAIPPLPLQYLTVAPLQTLQRRDGEVSEGLWRDYGVRVGNGRSRGRTIFG